MAILALAAILVYCSFFGQFAKPDPPKQEEASKGASEAEREAMEKLLNQLLQRLSPSPTSEPVASGEARVTIVEADKAKL
jgi:hypothetical protein